MKKAPIESCEPEGEAEPPGARRAGAALGDGGAPVEKADDATKDRLAKTVEAEIIPRLLRANPADPATGSSPIWREQIERFAVAILDGREEHATAFLDDLRRRGVGVERLFLEVLAPAAHHMGDLWCEDSYSFAEVGVGMVALNGVMRRLAPAFHAEAGPPRINGDLILLTPTPGEQHSFGLLLIAEFFRRDGWRVWSEPGADMAAVEAALRRDSFGVIGFSLSGEDLLDQLAQDIRWARRRSRNPDIGVMVGGAAFSCAPERAARVGADACASDVRDALDKARGLLRPAL